jgi:hypothetical protein
MITAARPPSPAGEEFEIAGHGIPDGKELDAIDLHGTASDGRDVRGGRPKRERQCEVGSEEMAAGHECDSVRTLIRA